MKRILLTLCLLGIGLLQMGLAAEELSWSQIQKQFRIPDWYANARLGIWTHWGPQSQPLKGGGWYARHMYMQDVGTQKWGAEAYPYHLRTYGHPSEAGYKEVLNAWKADKLDASGLVSYFKNELGARYVVAMANHHDHFDNFASTHQPWNSVNVGPKKDIIKLFADAARAEKLPFGVSSHDDRMLMFFEHAFGADKDGPKAGIPYDGHQTKADGKGKWWEGLDPADLYGPPNAKTNVAWQNEMKRKWVLRHRELIDRYRPDMLWFDGNGFPYKNYGKELCTYFYNQSFAGKTPYPGIIVAKIPEDSAIGVDIEMGVSETIRPLTWQGTANFTSWFYKEEALRQNSRTLIEILTDVSSKNGNLLLNVDLYGDGSIPPHIKKELDGFGAWVKRNAEAIFETRPWKIYGDNLNSSVRVKGEIAEADAAEVKKRHGGEHFNLRTVQSPPYGSDEVRFTTRGGKLYIFVLNPADGEIKIPSLGSASAQKPGKISHLSMIGSKQVIPWQQTESALLVSVPKGRPDDYAVVFEVIGAL